tara:strand:- start:665 stop:1186 length:522 start_codon:yes stop_codon:yes gene_type:complete
MAQEWRIERTLLELGMGRKKDDKLPNSPGNTKFNDMDWELFRTIVGTIKSSANKAEVAERRLKLSSSVEMPEWSREQRAQFVLAWNHNQLTSSERLKIWLKGHPGMSKLSHFELHEIAKRLIVGSDNTQPHLMKYCIKKTYRSKDYYVLSKKLHLTSPLTTADLASSNWKPPK